MNFYKEANFKIDFTEFLFMFLCTVKKNLTALFEISELCFPPQFLFLSFISIVSVFSFYSDLIFSPQCRILSWIESWLVHFESSQGLGCFIPPVLITRLVVLLLDWAESLLVSQIGMLHFSCISVGYMGTL